MREAAAAAIARQQHAAADVAADVAEGEGVSAAGGDAAAGAALAAARHAGVLHRAALQEAAQHAQQVHSPPFSAESPPVRVKLKIYACSCIDGDAR